MEELSHAPAQEILLWLLRRRRRFRVTGESMLPLLKPGDEVLLDPGAYRHRLPRPGDIVVARHPYQTDVRLIKRVAAVWPNGDCDLRSDNPDGATDSRTLGAIPAGKIIGRVTGRF